VERPIITTAGGKDGAFRLGFGVGIGTLPIGRIMGIDIQLPATIDSEAVLTTVLTSPRPELVQFHQDVTSPLLIWEAGAKMGSQSGAFWPSGRLKRRGIPWK